MLFLSMETKVKIILSVLSVPPVPRIIFNQLTDFHDTCYKHATGVYSAFVI
jgi:hypothetical protein